MSLVNRCHTVSRWKGKSMMAMFQDSVIISILLKAWYLLSSLILPLYLLDPEGKEDEDKENEGKENEGNEGEEEVKLFPSITNEEISNEFGSAKPCSTGLTTRLLPFKNSNGEIEWAFTEDNLSGNELDSFKMNNELSPVTSSSSNNDSILSKKKSNNQVSNHETPLSSTSDSSPFLPNDDEKSNDKIHQCPHCDAVFKIRGYLTRHLKKHAVKKAYSCPFHKFSIYIDENNITHKCHPNGGFSRRDTYKTHLKSRHFKYPKGTKTKERSNSPGNCSMCGEYFANSEIWCEIHVEGGECKFLPIGFKGKSRIKNRLRKQLLKKLKDNKINDATINAAAKAVVNPSNSNHRNGNSISSNSSSQDDYNTPPLDTPTSMTSMTPINHQQLQPQQPQPQQPQYQTSNSPTLSISSSINGNPTPSNLNNPIQQLHHQQQEQVNHLQQQAQQQPNPLQYQQQAIQNVQLPQFEQFQPHSHLLPKMDNFEDYDDEFCLDTEQLNFIDYSNDYMDLLKNHDNSILNQPLNNKNQNTNSNNIDHLNNINNYNNLNVDINLNNFNSYMNSQTQFQGY